MKNVARRIITIDPASLLVGFTTWMALLTSALFAFCLLSGNPFPGSDLFLWLLLTATALLMSGFSSFIYQLTRKSGVF